MFFVNDTATTEIYTLSLHDALPISRDPYVSPLFAADHTGLPPALVQVAELDPIRDDGLRYAAALRAAGGPVRTTTYVGTPQDRKSTRLNSSHAYILNAVFCLKKKTH